MLKTPNCYRRGCRHFQGVRQPDGTELTEVNVCPAFPDGIPARIANGDDLHLVVAEDQEDTTTVFEKAGE